MGADVLLGKSRFRIYDDNGRWAIVLPPNGDGRQRVVLVDKQSGQILGGSQPSTPYTRPPSPRAISRKQWLQQGGGKCRLLSAVDVEANAF